jgi:hypothetical protein
MSLRDGATAILIDIEHRHFARLRDVAVGKTGGKVRIRLSNHLADYHAPIHGIVIVEARFVAAHSSSRGWIMDDHYQVGIVMEYCHETNRTQTDEF